MRAVFVVCALSGCYRPGASCTVTCETGCPAELPVCQRGVCVAEGFNGSCGDAGLDDTGKPCFGTDSGIYRQICPGGTFVDMTLAGMKIDTDADCDFIVPPRAGVVGELELCGKAYDTVHIASLTAGGTRPLLVFARTLLAVDGVVDVASHVTSPTTPPPGIAIPCPVAIGDASTGGAGGSAGGSFGTAGGAGGAANGPQGGQPPPTIVPTFTRGGCSGSQGGMGVGTAGIGGHPGGAVYLASADSLVIGDVAVVNASGGGAPSTGTRSGGGGGGSGGMIVLDAPHIEIRGTVFALGGGGASGAASVSGGAGGDPIGPAMYGAGGTDSLGIGGDGGTGAAAGLMGRGKDGLSSGTGGGGGGGGGGLGFIKIATPVFSSTGSIEPMPTP